ncbi:hypothetical protein H4219_002318 [Mycoemilia scoparia]|uniref:Myb-like domain-containing protein n=1 Tax=Mycoemilia scoparia TaxID=417184 RepID=A0A9W8DP87_9FUNG|nr:hypothetical protein H4219_002318 [Mycoemilia scoparia]
MAGAVAQAAKTTPTLGHSVVGERGAPGTNDTQTPVPHSEPLSPVMHVPKSIIMSDENHSPEAQVSTHCMSPMVITSHNIAVTTVNRSSMGSSSNTTADSLNSSNNNGDNTNHTNANANNDSNSAEYRRGNPNSLNKAEVSVNSTKIAATNHEPRNAENKNSGVGNSSQGSAAPDLRKNPIPSQTPPQASTAGVNWWTPVECRELIQAYKELDIANKYPGNRSKKKAWESISDKLQTKSIVRSPHECHIKWKNLKRGYRKHLRALLIVQNGSVNGNPEHDREQLERVQFPYFKELDPIVGEKERAMLTCQPENSGNVVSLDGHQIYNSGGVPNSIYGRQPQRPYNPSQMPHGGYGVSQASSSYSNRSVPNHNIEYNLSEFRGYTLQENSVSGGGRSRSTKAVSTSSHLSSSLIHNPAQLQSPSTASRDIKVPSATSQAGGNGVSAHAISDHTGFEDGSNSISRPKSATSPVSISKKTEVSSGKSAVLPTPLVAIDPLDPMGGAPFNSIASGSSNGNKHGRNGGGSDVNGSGNDGNVPALGFARVSESPLGLGPSYASTNPNMKSLSGSPMPPINRVHSRSSDFDDDIEEPSSSRPRYHYNLASSNPIAVNVNNGSNGISEQDEYPYRNHHHHHIRSASSCSSPDSSPQQKYRHHYPQQEFSDANAGSSLGANSSPPFDLSQRLVEEYSQLRKSTLKVLDKLMAGHRQLVETLKVIEENKSKKYHGQS